MIKEYRNKYIALAVIAISALLIIVHPFYSVRYTDSRTNCLPYKLWFIDKTDKNLKAEEFIVFRTPANALHIPEHKVWVKKVLAVDEGRVEVAPAKAGETVSVKYNGIERKLPVGAHVTVSSSAGSQTFIAFATDSMGRPLPIIKSQHITVGHYYAYTPEERSYDSRYWGLVKKNEVLGKAYPIF